MTTPHFVIKDPVYGMTRDDAAGFYFMGGPTIFASHRAWKKFSPARVGLTRKPIAVMFENKPLTKDAATMSSAMARIMRPLGRLGIALILALANFLPAVLLAAELPNEPLTTERTLTDDCHELRAQRQLMQANVAAQNAELAVRIAAMNSAGEGQKLALLSALITQMAEQKTVMDERKDKLEERVIRHLLEHTMAQKGIDGNSIATCPLMNGVKITNDPISNDHNEPRAPAPR